jgi:Asp/Glu/hydantoin racemase
MPNVDLVNIVDDQLIFDINRNGSIDDDLEARTMRYFEAAERTHADVIFCTCSSIGEIADKAAALLSAKVVKIDEPMVEAAVRQATRIGVLATLASTLDPTARFIERKAQETGKQVTLIRGLAEGAFEAASEGNTAEHDDKIVRTAKSLLDQDVELFVLAQGSMARIEDRLKRETGNPVLSSMSSGIEQVAKTLDR